MTSDDQPIAPIIAALNVAGEWDDQDHAMSALVLIKINNFDTNRVSLGLYHSGGMDWFEMIGLVEAAKTVIADADIYGPGEGD